MERPSRCLTSKSLEREYGYQLAAATLYNAWLDTLRFTVAVAAAATRIGRRVSPSSWASVRMIEEISFPPTSLAGRGGAIRLKGGTMELGVLAYYSPPLSGCSGGSTKGPIDGV